MKKILISLLCAAASASMVSAQNNNIPAENADLFSMSEDNIGAPGVKVGMRYGEYRDFYRASDYVHIPGDPYSPALSGIASAIIPGFGQMICGEVGRGFAILGLSIGVPVIGTVGAILCSGYDHSVTFGSAVAIVTLGSLAVYVWNIVDAVQVAKIKNMYCRDIRNTYSASLKLYPSVGIIPASGGSRTSVGLTLALNFR